MSDKKTYTKREVGAILANAARHQLARALGQNQTAYDGDRNYYEVLGYPTEITIDQYELRYRRQDIARRIVDLPATDTWKNPPEITEDVEQETELETTPFIEQFGDLNARLKVWNALTRADRLSGIGRFGILLIGFRDGLDMSEPVDASKIKGQESVIYLRPLSEVFVTIDSLDENPQSPRLGQAEMYTVKLGDVKSKQQRVHWSRVIHLAENKLDSQVYATPRLEPVFNLLDDKMKIVGGTAEATWLNMRPGIAIGVDDGYTLTADSEDEWDQAISNYLHDPSRMLKAFGMKPEQLGASEVADPTGPHDVIIADMAAASGIPQRVLVGSAGGELSAAKEDTRQWGAQVSSRQINYAEPEVLRPLLDRLVQLGALPAPLNGPGAYNVGTLQPDGSYAWTSIIELSEEEKASATNDRASATRSLALPDGRLVLDENESREVLGFPPRQHTPQEELEQEMTETILNNWRKGKGDDESAKAAMSYLLANALERTGAFDEV